MSARVRCSWAAVAATATGLALSACGSSASTATVGHAGGARPAAGRFPVSVTVARFPRAQQLAQHVGLTLEVHNAGTRALPDVAVTICERSCAPSDHANEGTAAQAFSYDINGAPNTADPSRPLWIVNRGPGGCHLGCNQSGGELGGGVTANSNTWALGRLAPGATARFVWQLTPVVAGRHVVAWEVAGDLTGRARAVAVGGSQPPRGTFRVAVSSAAPHLRVTPSGRVVTTAAG